MRRLKRAEETTKSKQSKKRRKTQIQTPSGSKRFSNLWAAQLRAARHRLSYLFKMTAITLAGLACLAIAALGVFGQLDDASEMAIAQTRSQLTSAGYTIGWLDVVGSTHYTSDEVASLIGIEPGIGLSELDLESAKATLEAQSWIKSAELARLWPNRLAVIIDERQAFAVWQNEQIHHVIDATGQIIVDADPIDYSDLPQLVGLGANEQAGDFVPALLSYQRIASVTTHILRVGERRWSLRLVNGTEVLLPQVEATSALATLNALDQERGLLDYDAQIIDFRNSGEFVMRPWPDRAAEYAGRGA